MKRLGIVIWNMGIGGVQRQVADVITYVSINLPAWEVVLWVKHGDLGQYSELARLSRVRVVCMHGSRRRLQMIRDIWALGRVLRLAQLDVLLTFHDYLSIAAWWVRWWYRLGYEMVVYEPNLTSVYLREFRRIWWVPLVLRTLYPKLNRVIVPSEAARKDLIQNFGLHPDHVKKLSVWTLASQEKAQIRNIEAIFVGRLESQKQPLMLVDVLCRWKEIGYGGRIFILGEGSLAEDLRELAKRRGVADRLQLVGGVDQAKVAEYLSRSNVLLLPSRYEGMPLVIAEAYAHGVVPVVFDYVGAKEAVTKETGVLVQSANAMADATYAINSNPSLRGAYQRSGRRWQKKFMSERQLKDFVSEVVGAFRQDNPDYRRVNRLPG